MELDIWALTSYTNSDMSLKHSETQFPYFGDNVWLASAEIVCAGFGCFCVVCIFQDILIKSTRSGLFLVPCSALACREAKFKGMGV